LPRKTDANNPADWLWLAESDLAVVTLAATQEVGFQACRSKLAEVLEKIMKAELIRIGWSLEKTHDLDRLLDELVVRQSDLAAYAEPLCDVLAEVYFTDRYPGFDLDDPAWPTLRQHTTAIANLLNSVKSRLPQVGGKT
jgi:HEPN domain-containing protein